ncbi:MAG: YicC/YloC family endoribonuclease [bacterium]
MIRSMTGYGSATNSGDAGEFFFELKSVNNRFLDLNVRMPRELSALEIPVREEIRRLIFRGKVDAFLRWKPAAGAKPLCEINVELLRGYAAQVRSALCDEAAGAPADLASLLDLPGVVTPAGMEGDMAPIEQAALTVVREALAALDSSRASEGRVLVASIKERLGALEQFRLGAEAFKDEVVTEYRSRLSERARELATALDTSADPARIELEVALMADKCDITEELVRIGAHIKAFEKLCNPAQRNPVGKSMEFLVQELLRETNTIGNKARGLKAAASVVEMKAEIEKIREQVQNIE